MTQNLKTSLQTIESYKTSSPHYGELLDILGDILILRETYRKNIRDILFPIPDNLIATKIRAGFPLVDLATTECDWTAPRQYFLDLLEIAEKRTPGDTRELARQIREGEVAFVDLLRQYCEPAEEEETDDTQEESLDLVELFLEESLRPFLEKVAEGYGKTVEAIGWTEGYCPICGREPKIGKIREEEGRFLFCSQCGYEWHFLRIKCPFCGNEEQQTLAYFTIEGEERYRVDVCNECKRYIKMVDVRESQDAPDLDVEDIATLHLDMLANEEGYD